MTLSRHFLMFCLAALTLLAQGCAATSAQATAGECSDDAALTVRVQAALFREPSLKSSEISIESSRGVVQMGGFVVSVVDRLTAVEATRRVSGVIGIRNGMTVRDQL